MEWKTIFLNSILAIFIHSIQKMFHSIINFILKFSSIFHSILPHQDKFRPEAMRNLYCNFATLNVTLPVAAREGTQYGTMYLTPDLKHYRNELWYHKNSLSMKISTT